MLKESKIRVLENFYATDYIFFGKSINEVEMCCPIVKEEYLSVKGALMSVFVEMLQILDHNPLAIQESIDGEDLRIVAKESAINARNASEQIVITEKARNDIKENLQETLKGNPDADVTSIVEETIRKKAFGLAIDNLMVARALTEADQPERMNEWEGRIVEDSYKILRDNLVESAYQILYDVTDDAESVNELSVGTAVVAGAAGGAALGFASLRIKAKGVCDRRYEKGSPQYKACVKEIMKQGYLRSQEIKKDKEKRKLNK